MGTRRILFLALLLGLGRLAFGLETLVTFYGGQADLPAGITMGDWGYFPRAIPTEGTQPIKMTGLSGKVYGLKITTSGRYQGARLDFAKPVDTTAFIGVKSTYLELYLRVPPSTTATTATPPPPPATPPPATTGTTDTPKPSTVPMPAFKKNLRFTFLTDKGMGLLIIPPEKMVVREEIAGRWARIDIPLSDIEPGFPTGGQLSRLLITSDDPIEFCVGRLAVVRDDEPLTLQYVFFPPFLEAGERINFVARVGAGLAQYQVTWNFTGGTGIDAVGDRVSYVFDKEGNYTISCAVRDLSGGKDTVTSEPLEVRVSRKRD